VTGATVTTTHSAAATPLPSPPPPRQYKRLRPILRYFGGKYRIAPWIVSQLPPHDLYIEPFGGSAAVLLAKPPSRVEVYNDLDAELVSFFRVLRERPEDLQRAVRLTPFSRLEFARAHEETADPLEAARRYFVLSWQGFGGAMRGKRSGWRTPTKQVDRFSGGCSVASATWASLDHLELVARRLLRVSIECVPAVELLCRYDLPGAVFYVDPPYLLTTRARPERGYRHEMGKPEDHVELLEALCALQHAAVVLSAYPAPLYEDRLVRWEKRSVRTTTNQTRKPQSAQEVLWLNPAAVAAQRQASLSFRGPHG
jgi:DNA adenine methylase